jgi:hypothetical protein
VVVIEKLNVKGMAHAMSSIAGAGWSMFARSLDYKLKATGGSLVHLRPGHNSSFSAAVRRPSWAVGTPAFVGDAPRSLPSG